MLKRIILIAATTSFAVAMAFAGQNGSKVTLQVNKTSPASGKQMYVSYCAPCHGPDARGHGPVAAALKNPVPDLTFLSHNNRGKYPATHVVAVLENGAEISAHGSALMPVWGPILGSMEKTNPQDRLLRISNLSRYLETLQVK